MYHLRVADGEAAFGGPAEPEDVKMEQDWQTAVDVATGELNAQEAFIGGKIRLFGDQQTLIDAQPGVRGAADAVFAGTRADDATRREPTMPETPRSRPTPSGWRSDSWARVLVKHVPTRFTALKTAVPPPDEAYGAPLAAVGRAASTSSSSRP